MTSEGDEPKLQDVSKVETRVRHFDADGELTSEVVTVIVHKTKPFTNEHTGMYL